MQSNPQQTAVSILATAETYSSEQKPCSPTKSETRNGYPDAASPNPTGPKAMRHAVYTPA
jgi:hypothetical protein